MLFSGFRDSTIRFQITLLVGLGAVAFLISFLFSEHAISQNTQELERQSSVDYPLIASMYRVNVSLVGVRDAFSTAVNDTDPDALEDGIRRAATLRTDIVGIMQQADADDASQKSVLQSYDHYVSTAETLAKGVTTHSIDTSQLYAGITRSKAAEEGFQDRYSSFQNQQMISMQGHLQRAYQGGRTMLFVGTALALVTFSALIYLGWLVVRGVTGGLDHVIAIAETITRGNLDAPIRTDLPANEIGRLIQSIRAMRTALKAQIDADQEREQHQRQLAEINACMRGALSVERLCANLMDRLPPILGCQIGAFYVYNRKKDVLDLKGSYALCSDDPARQQLALGESLVGAAGLSLQPLTLDQVPPGYLSIRSGMIDSEPRSLLIYPVARDEKLVGIIELGALQPLTEAATELLEACVESIALAVGAAQSREELLQAGRR